MGDYNRDYGSAHNPGNAELQLGRKREEYSLSIPVTEQGDSPYRSALSKSIIFPCVVKKVWRCNGV
jgi:hypothetical protein